MLDIDEITFLFDKGFSCSQIIFSEFAPRMGLSKEQALKIAGPFGGGMARLGNTCGAVTGALMVLGLKYGMYKEGDSDTKEKNYLIAQEFIEQFTALHGSISCKELLNYDINNPKDYEILKEKNLFRTMCPKFVKDSMCILEKLI